MTGWVEPGLTRALADRRNVDALGIAAPLASVLTLGRSPARVGLAIGALIALLGHGTASARALTSLVEMQRSARDMRYVARDWMDQVYEFEDRAQRPKEQPAPPPPPPPPPKEIEKEKIYVKEKVEDPYEADRPQQKPAEAPNVLTRKDDPDAPRDQTSDGFVNGPGEGTHGFVSAKGEGKKPVDDPRANDKGKKDGNGGGGPPAVAQDKSSVPQLLGGSGWSCPFPAEADDEGIDSAVVTLYVTVRPDGTAASVTVSSDPGNGFGRSAKQCALTRKYKAGTDKDGTAVSATLGPINVRFNR